MEDEGALGVRPSESKKKKIGKDPTASTSFLPDPEREQKEDDERHQLIEKFLEEQTRAQKEQCELSFTYFDGSNIRRTVRVTKDTDIATLLTKCKAILAKDFKNLASITSEALMFIKENIILPKVPLLVHPRIAPSTTSSLTESAGKAESSSFASKKRASPPTKHRPPNPALALALALKQAQWQQQVQ